MTELYRVEIVEDATGKVVRSLAATGVRNAGRIEQGLWRNLNHAKFFVRIVRAAASIGKTGGPA